MTRRVWDPFLTERDREHLALDCTFDRTQASHAINLFDMHQKYADVIDSAGAIAYLESLG